MQRWALESGLAVLNLHTLLRCVLGQISHVGRAAEQACVINFSQAVGLCKLV